jgi:choline kinase
MKKQIFRNDLNIIILAAGQGKRLSPLTNNKPKCMVDLFGKTLLEWQVSAFKKCGITDISVVTGYRSELIDLPGLEFFQNKKFETTNMVESLFCASEKLNKSTIVSYGDIIFEEKVLNSLIESKSDFSIVVDKEWKKYWKMRFDNPLNDAESLKIDIDNNITSIGQKVQNIDEIEGQYVGLMKFQNNGLKKIKEFYEKAKNQSTKNFNPLNPIVSFQQSYMTDLLQGLINTGCKLKAVMIENGWLELDSIDDYKKYTELFSQKKISEFIDLHD